MYYWYIERQLIFITLTTDIFIDLYYKLTKTLLFGHANISNKIAFFPLSLGLKFGIKLFFILKYEIHILLFKTIKQSIKNMQTFLRFCLKVQ